ncbi:MAG: hypothetical protein V3T77_09080 [Planctomycetota bacterium]
MVQLKTAHKIKILFALLVVLLVWPLIHRWLIVRYDISPWRLFGWAMYCEPKIEAFVDIKLMVGKRPVDWPGSRLPDRIEKERKRYAWRRFVYGRLVSPAELARISFETFPDVDRVEIRFRKVYLDGDTGHVEALRELYQFQRNPIAG